MKIALAQIDMRLGDISAIASRIADQARLAAQQGAQLICTPAPLLGGFWAGQLVHYPNYEHDLVRALTALAAELEREGIAALVPALAATDDGDPYDCIFEAFLLRDGRVAPLRRTMARAREGAPVDPWLPVVFDLAGTRVAVTFDVERDIEELPSGCDLLIHFQAIPYSAADVMTQPAQALRDGRYDKLVRDAGVWLACMAPVGGFDEAVYTGGSFVMDDSGRPIAQAPSFEEALLVQEVRRGVQLPRLESFQLASYSREHYLWEALRVHLRDTVAAAGATQVAVPLGGDLQSSLLAALAVDAVGSGNVVGLLCGRDDALTPADEAREQDRVDNARAVAERLHLRMIERAGADLHEALDRPVARGETARVRGDLESYCLADVARSLGAYPVCPLTKTEYALAAPALSARAPAALAPFGDVYLTELEFLARARNDVSDVIPHRLVTLNTVEDAMRGVLKDAVQAFDGDAERRARILELFCGLEPSQIDELLRGHVDRNLSLDECALGASDPEVAALLLLLVRRGEGARRSLPMAPTVSARSFADRSWPVALAWSDTGRKGAPARDIASLVEMELGRIEEGGERYGDRVRHELARQLGEVFGIDPARLEALGTDEGQQRLRENMEQLAGQLGDVLEQMADEDDDFREFLEHGCTDPSGGGSGSGPVSGDDDGDGSFFSEN